MLPMHLGLGVRTRPIEIVIHRSLNKVFGLIKVNNNDNIIMSRQFHGEHYKGVDAHGTKLLTQLSMD